MSTPGDILNALGREARARLAGARDATMPRVFRGRSVEELIPRIERELGADAIVVRRREGLTGGVLGFFQHPWVEIEAIPGTAGVDVYDEAESVAPPVAGEEVAQPLPPPGQPVPPVPPPHAASAYAASGPPPGGGVPAAGPELGAQAGRSGAGGPLYAQPPVEPPPAAAGFIPDAPYPPPAPPSPPIAPPEPVFAQGSAYVTAHLAALARAEPSAVPPPLVPEQQAAAAAPPPFVSGPARRPLSQEPVDFHDLIPQQTRRPAAPIAPPPQADWTARAPAERRTVQPGSHARARAGVEKGLARYGIGEQLAGELIDMALAHALPLAPRLGLAAAVRSTLAQRIPVAPPLSARGASIVIVGAGGSGKTTCAAALLSAYRAGSTLSASFATIAAEESGELHLLMAPQLLKPAPMESPRAMRALRRARAEGLAVLDTPRLSPSDRKGIRRLGRLLGELDPDRILLALPATLGGAAAAQLLEALAPLRAHALVVTHADETDQIGVAVEVACRFELAPELMLSHARTGGWRLRRLDPVGLAGMVLP